MPWVILSLAALAIGYWYGSAKRQNTPPPPQPPPAPPGPNTGAVPTTSDGLGNIVVALTPGEMGTLSMQSSASVAGNAANAAVNAALGGGAANIPALPALVLQAPQGGAVTGCQSSNLMVITGGLLDPSNLGQPVPSMMVAPPISRGSAQLTVVWTDATGAQNQSTISIQAS